MRTAQEVFDHVVSHLRTQGARCTIDDGRCMYRGQRGMKCAVGWMIPDEEYSETLEECGNISGILDAVKGVGPLRVRHNLSLETIAELSEHKLLLVDLQFAHDKCTVETWEDQFKGIAMAHNLEYTAP